MPLAREQRKLAAIVAADVVGYSRLMGRGDIAKNAWNGRNIAVRSLATPVYSVVSQSHNTT